MCSTPSIYDFPRDLLTYFKGARPYNAIEKVTTIPNLENEHPVEPSHLQNGEAVEAVCIKPSVLKSSKSLY